MTKHPLPKFSALILNKKEEMLLGRDQGKYFLIEGFLEYGQPLEESVAGQIKNLTGLKVKFEKIFLLQDNRFENPDKKHYLYLNCLCRTKEAKGKFKKKPFFWVSLKEVEGLDLDRLSQNAIEAYFS